MNEIIENETIESEIYSKELQKKIKYKIIVGYLRLQNKITIKELYLDNQLYYKFEKYPYVNFNTDENMDSYLTQCFTGKIVNGIIDKTDINVLVVEPNRIKNCFTLLTEFYILEVKYRLSIDIYNINNYNSNKDFFKLNGLTCHIDKHKTTAGIIVNILKEIFLDVYFNTEKDFFGYFDKNELERIRMEKEIINF